MEALCKRDCRSAKSTGVDISIKMSQHLRAASWKASEMVVGWRPGVGGEDENWTTSLKSLENMTSLVLKRERNINSNAKSIKQSSTSAYVESLITIDQTRITTNLTDKICSFIIPETFFQESRSGFEKASCENDDGSGSVSSLDVLCFGQLNQHLGCGVNDL